MSLNSKGDMYDIFRHAMPGYIFLIVLLSFYVVHPGGPDLPADSGIAVAVIGLIAGSPLGYIFQNVYRIFHFWFREPKMERKELGWINASVLKNEQSVWQKTSCLEGRKPSMAIELFLSSHLGDATTDSLGSKIEAAKDRVHFLNNRMHSMGASIVAIIFGLIFFMLMHLRERTLSLMWFDFNLPINQPIKILALMWGVVIFGFWMVARNAKRSYHITLRLIIEIYRSEIRGFLCR